MVCILKNKHVQIKDILSYNHQSQISAMPYDAKFENFNKFFVIYNAFPKNLITMQNIFLFSLCYLLFPFLCKALWVIIILELEEDQVIYLRPDEKLLIFHLHVM